MTVVRRLCMMCVVVVAGLLLPAATASAGGISQVTLTLEWSSIPPTTTSTLSLIVGLAPSDAFGDVVLYDNGVVVDQGHNYRQQWSALLSGLHAGAHTLRVVFTPDVSTGFAPSEASASFTVLGPPQQTSPSPSPSPTAMVVVVVTPPQTRAGGGVRTSPTPATRVLSHSLSKSTSKSLPVTGAPVSGELRLGLASLLAGGLAWLACARRWRWRRQVPA